MFKTLKLNLQYLRTVNSCDMEQFQKFMTNLIMTTDGSETQVKKLFTKKCYIWNIMRGKDFYKSMSMYISNVVTGNFPEEAARIFDYVVESSGFGTSESENNDICRFFVNQVMKKTPFLSEWSVKLMSTQRLEMLLKSEQLDQLYVDDKLKPFVDTIMSMRSSLALAEALGVLE